MPERLIQQAETIASSIVAAVTAAAAIWSQRIKIARKLKLMMADPEDRTSQLLASIQDLNRKVETLTTTVQEAAAALAIQQSMNRMILDIAEYITWAANPTGQVTFMSEHATKLCGRQVRHLEGSDWLNMVHDDDRDKVTEKWQRAVQMRAGMEIRFRTVHQETGAITTVTFRAIPSATTSQFCGWVGTIMEG